MLKRTWTLILASSNLNLQIKGRVARLIDFRENTEIDKVRVKTERTFYN